MTNPNVRLRDGRHEAEFEAMVDMANGKVRYVEVSATSYKAAYDAVKQQLSYGEIIRGVLQVVDA